MKNKTLLLVVVSSLVLGALFYFGTQFYKAQQVERYGFAAQENFKVFVPDHAVRKGNPEAKVIVTEFLDPECESCRGFHPYIIMLLNEFEGKIQFVVRYAPFHGNSIFVIKILEAARMQNKYWEVLDVLFQHQPEWGSHHHPRPELIWNYLPRTGVDIEQIKKDMEDPAIQEIIKQDRKDMETLQIRGTPTFFVNGKPLESFGPVYLKRAIELALEEK